MFKSIKPTRISKLGPVRITNKPLNKSQRGISTTAKNSRNINKKKNLTSFPPTRSSPLDQPHTDSLLSSYNIARSPTLLTNSRVHIHTSLPNGFNNLNPSTKRSPLSSTHNPHLNHSSSSLINSLRSSSLLHSSLSPSMCYPLLNFDHQLSTTSFSSTTDPLHAIAVPMDTSIQDPAYMSLSDRYNYFNYKYANLLNDSNNLTTQQQRHYRIPHTLNFQNPFDTTPIKQRRNCWWQITRDGKDLGYVEFHLFDEYANNAVRFFRTLCRGDEPLANDQALTLKGSYIHEIVPGNWISGGDLLGSMGTTKHGAMLGGLYDIDVLAMLHYRNTKPGLISFSSDGKRFGSYWRIIYDEAPWKDGLEEVFGEVVKGWDVIKEIENTRVNMRSQPLVPVIIAECGECPY